MSPLMRGVCVNVIVRYIARGAGVGMKAARSTCGVGYQSKQWRNGSVMEAVFEYQRQAWGYSTMGQSYGAACVLAGIDE